MSERLKVLYQRCLRLGLSNHYALQLAKGILKLEEDKRNGRDSWVFSKIVILYWYECNIY